jgi:uncharacterized protein
LRIVLASIVVADGWRAFDSFKRGDSIPPMDCRPRCAACCIAPSISTPIPGMPQGKPAGVRCVQLDGEDRCRLFGRPERPAVCRSLQPSQVMCGESREHALTWLGHLERATAPAPIPTPG